MLRRFQHDQKLEKMATTVQKPNQVKSYCVKNGKGREGDERCGSETASLKLNEGEYVGCRTKFLIQGIQLTSREAKAIQAGMVTSSQYEKRKGSITFKKLSFIKTTTMIRS